jgi:High potential iron-sulfur protein
MSAFSRRSFLAGAVQTLPIVALAAAVPRQSAAATQACVKPESDALRRALEYTDPAPDARQSCAQCGFFTGDKPPCGTCALIQGPVSSSAHCHSWSDRNN